MVGERLVRDADQPRAGLVRDVIESTPGQQEGL
jgi:hypothetical protein